MRTAPTAVRLLGAALLLAAAAPAGAFWLSRARSALTAENKLFAQGKYAQVAAALSPERMQQLDKPDLERAYLILAESLERQGRLDQALGVYQVGVKLFPRDLRLLTELAFLLHNAGLEQQAKPLFEKVLRIHPNNASANLGLAEIDGALGFLDRSAQHYEHALETMASQPGVWRDYAEVLYDMRDYKTAELAARKALALAADDDDAQIDLALILRAEGRLPEALAALEQVLARRPDRVEVSLLRGLWLLEAGRYDDAAQAAQAALKRDPQDPLARWLRARVELKADRYNEAVEDLQAAAAAKGSPFVAKAAGALLERLQGGR